jgi:hypothetical protein
LVLDNRLSPSLAKDAFAINIGSERPVELLMNSNLGGVGYDLGREFHVDHYAKAPTPAFITVPGGANIKSDHIKWVFSSPFKGTDDFNWMLSKREGTK